LHEKLNSNNLALKSIMRKITPLLIFLFCLQFNYSQVSVPLSQFADSLKPKVHYAFMPGDIIINTNIGKPQIGPSLIQIGINAYEKISSDKSFDFSMSNRGVYNARLEYGVLDNLGLGLAISYWDIDVNVTHNYNELGTAYQDELNINISSMALGVRGNFHLVDEVESKFIDPFIGLTIGSTLKKKVFTYTTSNPERQEVQDFINNLPEQVTNRLKLSSQGWVPHLATTFGLRIYPVKFIGINLEAGWDHGTFLYGGIVFKFSTKPIKAFVE